jgi:hypothetical protein
MSRIGTAFERLSKREKIMVGSLGATVLIFAMFLFYFFVGRGSAQLEVEIKDQQADLLKLQLATPEYLEKVDFSETSKRRALKNADLNLKNLIYDIAGKVSFEARIGGQKKLNDSDVLDLPSGSVTMLTKRSRRGSRKKKDSKVGFWRKDQTIKFKTEPTWDAIDALIKKLDVPDQMIYVRQIDVTRYGIGRRRTAGDESRLGNYAGRNSTITVSAIYYEEKAE